MSSASLWSDWHYEDGHCHAAVRRPGRFRQMAARSFVRIVQYEADVTVWPRCWNSVSSLRRAVTFPAWRSTPADRLDVRLRYLSALPRIYAPNYGLPDVTGNVHLTWAAFLCGYPLLPFFSPTKNAQRHADLSWYMYSGALPSCNSCYVCTVMHIPIVVRHNKTR